MGSVAKVVTSGLLLTTLEFFISPFVRSPAKKIVVTTLSLLIIAATQFLTTLIVLYDTAQQWNSKEKLQEHSH